jgi:phosphate transport system protein
VEEDLHINRHISRKYNQELEGVRGKLLAMGGRVEAQCQKALEALLRGDGALAGEVARSDHEINQMEVEITAECTGILARRQPAASDLRLLLSVIRIASDLERIGDEAEQIGRLAQRFAEQRERHAWVSEPRHLGASAVSMLHDALNAFARLDVADALKVAERDPEVDREFEALTRQLLTHVMEEPQRVGGMLQVNWCARAFERIGDHAVNLCEEVIYLVKGSDVRHLSPDEIRELLHRTE